jgi:hypothetical protein
MKAINAQLPGEHIAIDLAGPLPTTKSGNVRLLVIVDVCTRFVFLRALPNKNGINIATALWELFCTIGFPKIIQSDNGKEFVNNIIKIMTSKMNIDHRLITPYHPRGNGVAENHVKTTIQMIRKQVKAQGHTWDEHLPFIQLSMNTRNVSLHNSSPFSLFFARQHNGFSNYCDEKNNPMSQELLLERLEYMTKIVFPAIKETTQNTQKRMIERFNRTVLLNEFPDGAKVMTLDPILGDKLTPKYEGPYTVVNRNTGGAYILRDGTGALLGRSYAPSQLKLVLDDEDESNTYEVEKIIAHRPHLLDKTKKEYLVKWKNYSSKLNTWEPKENFIEQQLSMTTGKTQKILAHNLTPVLFAKTKLLMIQNLNLSQKANQKTTPLRKNKEKEKEHEHTAAKRNKNAKPATIFKKKKKKRQKF